VTLRLTLAGRVLLPLMKRRMLDELARVTAEGFGTGAPKWTGKSFDTRLSDYARFTAREAGLLVAAGDDSATEVTRQRLRSGATRVGASLRAALGVRRADEAFAALKLIYHQIGIEVDGGPSGGITVGRCFFADYYDGRVCTVVEALDQGLVAGLFGGASLAFFERLTEGRPCCRASIDPLPAAR
jgi:hypothetical protein